MRLTSAQARQQVRCTRKRCGQASESISDSDGDTAWEDEMDDTLEDRKLVKEIAEAPLAALKGLNWEFAVPGQDALLLTDESVVPSVEDSDVESTQDVNQESIGQRFTTGKAVANNDVAPTELAKQQQQHTESDTPERPQHKAKRREAKNLAKHSRGAKSPQAKVRKEEKMKSPRHNSQEHEALRQRDVKKNGSVGTDIETSKTDQERHQEWIAQVDDAIRGMRNFSNTKQVERFEHGGMKGLSKSARQDLERMKKERDAERERAAWSKEHKFKRPRGGKRNMQLLKDRPTESLKPVQEAKTLRQGFHNPMKQ